MWTVFVLVLGGGANGLRATFHPDDQEADIGWRNAGDTTRLTQSLRTDFFEFLARLFAEARDGHVIHPGWNLFIFHRFDFLDVFFLARDVAGVFELDFDLLDFFRGVVRILIREVGVGGLWSLEELSERGRTGARVLETHQFGGDVVFLLEEL